MFTGPLTLLILASASLLASPPDTGSTDSDGDGYQSDEDCDDTDASIHPGAEEVPNEVDDNCDGTIDEGTYLYDDDGDGFAEIGSSGDELDCDDADDSIYPGADEVCDGLDNDCDGTIDESCSDTGDIVDTGASASGRTAAACSSLPAPPDSSGPLFWLVAVTTLATVARRRT